MTRAATAGAGAVPRWPRSFGITVTGIVYSTVLARIHEPHGAAEMFINDVFHYLSRSSWWWAGCLRATTADRRPDARAVAALPVAWFAYTLVRGAIWRWYPYPFLDVPSHGYLRVIVNAVLVTVVLGLVAGLFAWGRPRAARATASGQLRLNAHHPRRAVAAGVSDNGAIPSVGRRCRPGRRPEEMRPLT